MSLHAVLSDHDPDGHCLEFDSPRHHIMAGANSQGKMRDNDR
jgi:hypothetical protein